MAKSARNGVFQGWREVRSFLTERWPTASDLTQALALRGVAVPPETVKNWYRPTAKDMSAVTLLRVILALGKADEFAEWVNGLERADATQEAADAGRARTGKSKGK